MVRFYLVPIKTVTQGDRLQRGHRGVPRVVGKDWRLLGWCD